MSPETIAAVHDAMQRDPDHRRHATGEGYKTYKCRCEKCKEFWNARARANRAAAKKKRVPKEVHGTMTGYMYYGCKCEACAMAKSRSYHRQKSARGPKLGGMYRGSRKAQNQAQYQRKKHRMAVNKTIVDGVLAQYVGDDREEVRKLMLKVAALARTDEREVTTKKLREKREWVSQAPAEGKVARVKKRWTLEAIDSLTSVI